MHWSQKSSAVTKQHILLRGSEVDLYEEIRWSICTDTSEQKNDSSPQLLLPQLSNKSTAECTALLFSGYGSNPGGVFFVMRVVNWGFIAQDSAYTDQFSAPLCKWTAPVLTMALVCAVWARWVLDWSLDPCYLGEFSGLIIKLVFIFALICGIIILICMYLPGLLSQAIFLAVSEPD